MLGFSFLDFKTVYGNDITLFERLCKLQQLFRIVLFGVLIDVVSLKGYTPTQAFVDNILTKKQYENLAKTQYTDDSKVTDHYAIIPTGQLTELGALSPLQRKVFDLIVRRFLSIFSSSMSCPAFSIAKIMEPDV